MRLGETVRNASLAALLVTASCGSESSNVSATKPRGEIAGASTKAPESPFVDPTKKQVTDYLQAFLDGRIEDVMNLTPLAYRDQYRNLTQGIMNSYIPCRGRKIIDVSIIENQSGVAGVGQLNQPCAIVIGGYPADVKQIAVWLIKVDGKFQPAKIVY